MSLIVAKELEKTYIAGDISVHAIRGVDFAIEPGSFVSFIGPSGSGKSTLLNMIGCLDPPTKGTLRVAGEEITGLNPKEAARFRGEYIDEPTANLDRKTAGRIIALMKKMRDEFSTTFVFSTHDPRIVDNVEITFSLEDGKLMRNENTMGEGHV